jgi:hypothetical protein
MPSYGNDPFLLAVARGEVPGHRLVNVPGRHEVNVETTLMGDLSLVPSVVKLPNPGGIQMEVVSTDNTEDKAAGDNALTVHIHYIDSVTLLATFEEVVLAGTTPVNTVSTTIGKILHMHVQDVGVAGNTANGRIDLRNTAGSVVYETIPAGGNQSLSARWHLACDEVGYLIGWHCSGLKKRIDFFMRATADRDSRELVAGTFLFQDTESCESSNSGWLDLHYAKIPPLAEVKISALADAAGGEAAGSFTLLLVKQQGS